jgi:hypothetical protein
MAKLPMPRVSKPGPVACTGPGFDSTSKSQYLLFMDEPPAPELEHGHQQSTMARSLVLLIESSRPRTRNESVTKKAEGEINLFY